MNDRTMHVQTYYHSLGNLQALFDRTARSLGHRATSREEHAAWKTALRARLREITGVDRAETCALEPQVVETVAKDGYRRDKVLIRTEPGVTMPMYVLVPDGMKAGERRAVVIATHGHSSGGKLAVAGITEIPVVAETVRRHNFDYGVQMVRRGYVVFCPDARGFGERREPWRQGDGEEVFLHSACVPLNNAAMCLGRTVTGMWTWDLMRLVDYIGTRADCDAGRLACAGLSGGGLQALWHTALDDRVRCAVSSGYFYGYRDSLLDMENCACNYVPHLWETVDMGDLGALIAPRPFLVETGTRDYLNGPRGLDNVREQVEITRGAYALFGAQSNLVHAVFEGEHLWHGEQTWPFLARSLTAEGPGGPATPAARL